VATANAVAYCQAIPHFVDSESTNLGIDVFKLRKYLEENTYFHNKKCMNKKTFRPITAIIPVHIFGHPVDMDALNTLCAEYNLIVIEDASESLGSWYKGKHTGNLSGIAVLSFNGNKTITTGGGGAILFKDKSLAQKAKHLSTTAKIAHRWQFYHDELGYNYRLPNINAALGCAQIEQLPSFIERKRNLAKRYQDVFENINEGYVLREPHYAQSNYWLNAFILNKPNRQLLQSMIETANENEYGVRGLWTPLHKLPMYQNCPKMDLSQTMDLFDSVIALPSSADL
jgi:perosamine synthetase